jgi:hypothetical protein
MTEQDTTGATRTDHAVRWVVFHAGELTAVLGPLVLAATVTGWFATASAAAALLWAAHEIHLIRTRRAIPAIGRRDRGQLTEATTDTREVSA